MPVILQSTKSTIQYLGLEVTARLARAAINQVGVEAWLHLDHAQDMELIQQALDAGYDSVMIDASEKPVEVNRKITRKVGELIFRAFPYVQSVTHVSGLYTPPGKQGVILKGQ